MASGPQGGNGVNTTSADVLRTWVRFPLVQISTYPTRRPECPGRRFGRYFPWCRRLRMDGLCTGVDEARTHLGVFSTGGPWPPTELSGAVVPVLIEPEGRATRPDLAP